MGRKPDGRRVEDLAHSRPGVRIPMRVPLDLPPSKFKIRMPETIRYMKDVIRSRQTVMKEIYEDLEEEFDWKEELAFRWMPVKGRYIPRLEYAERKNRKQF